VQYLPLVFAFYGKATETLAIFFAVVAFKCQSFFLTCNIFITAY
jgi:hypothetical protein